MGIDNVFQVEEAGVAYKMPRNMSGVVGKRVDVLGRLECLR